MMTCIISDGRPWNSWAVSFLYLSKNEGAVIGTMLVKIWLARPRNSPGFTEIGNHSPLHRKEWENFGMGDLFLMLESSDFFGRKKSQLKPLHLSRGVFFCRTTRCSLATESSWEPAIYRPNNSLRYKVMEKNMSFPVATCFLVQRLINQSGCHGCHGIGKKGFSIEGGF